MLEGIRTNEIIVGAYTDGGGICPMLAAHRNGGRTNLISFARAWDKFAYRGTRLHVARRATERELLVLRTHLEASLLEEDAPAAEMAAALAEHRELIARRQAERRMPARETGVRIPARAGEWPANGDRPAPGDRSAPGDRPAPAERPGDPDRSEELRARPGWAWLRVFRRYDEYERALELLHEEHDALRERELVG